MARSCDPCKQRGDNANNEGASGALFLTGKRDGQSA